MCHIYAYDGYRSVAGASAGIIVYFTKYQCFSSSDFSYCAEERRGEEEKKMDQIIVSQSVSQST